MKSIKYKELITSLIKDDLINTKLVTGLNDLGLDALGYYLHLSDTIFELMGFPENEHSEEVFQYYLKQLKRVKRHNVNRSHKSLDALALDIYNQLERRKANGK